MLLDARSESWPGPASVGARPVPSHPGDRRPLRSRREIGLPTRRGGKISAFASLHVAVVLMILLMARYYGLRFLARALAVYLALTMLATIYLGWHFVVDLPAGVAIGYAAVLLGR